MHMTNKFEDAEVTIFRRQKKCCDEVEALHQQVEKFKNKIFASKEELARKEKEQKRVEADLRTANKNSDLAQENLKCRIINSPLPIW